MIDCQRENQQSLASLLGVSTEEAAQLLDLTIAIRYDPTEPAARSIADSLALLLARTVSSVLVNPPTATAVAEVVVGSLWQTQRSAIRIHISDTAIEIGSDVAVADIPANTHPIIRLAAAAYGAGAALRAAIPPLSSVIPSSDSNTLRVPFCAIVGRDGTWLSKPCAFADTFLAGAGAIGNGFIWALTNFNVSGAITIVDPDSVSNGNLNRCVLFGGRDIGRPKAAQLCARAGGLFPGLKLVPSVTSLQDLSKGSTDPRWLRRLIVAVDSPRVRRHLQAELPREVFDASTTGAREFVIHHNLQPTETACMACIYHEAPDELAREKHIADALGVSLADVQEHYISASAAERIHALLGSVPVEQLKGQAYDSLFKALCSEATLRTAEDRQVLAPFAFVSVLAGLYLAVEVVRRNVLGTAASTYNYWRLSPWHAPVADLKQLRPRNAQCELCGQPALLRAVVDLWANAEP